MKKENKIITVCRYFSLLLVIALGLISIIGTGGGQVLARLWRVERLILKLLQQPAPQPEAEGRATLS